MNSSSSSSDKAQLESLLATVEKLRQSKYPTLDAELVREVLMLHSGTTLDTELARGVEQAVEARIQQEL